MSRTVRKALGMTGSQACTGSSYIVEKVFITRQCNEGLVFENFYKEVHYMPGRAVTHVSEMVYIPHGSGSGRSGLLSAYVRSASPL